MVFTYTTETGGSGSGQSLYNITVPTGGVVCDVLIVGGSGGGGKFGGGVGGGGVLFTTNITLTSGSLRVGNVGLGTVEGSYVNGVNGADSYITINSIQYIVKGGGGGGSRLVNALGQSGSTGGSGGGGSHSNESAYQGLGGTSNKNTYANFQSFGNNGGKGRPGIAGIDPNHASGGGGGTGSAGSDFSYTTGGGNGGASINYSTYFGTLVGHNGWFAGGVGGNTYQNVGGGGYGNDGNGLLGGGGIGRFDGGVEYSGGDGLPNTGVGGGGAKYDGGTDGNYDGDFIIKKSVNNVDTNNLTIKSTSNIEIGTKEWLNIPGTFILSAYGNTFVNNVLSFGLAYYGSFGNFPCNKLNFYPSTGYGFGIGIGSGSVEYFTGGLYGVGTEQYFIRN
jgi:hypothetical protein